MKNKCNNKEKIRMRIILDFKKDFFNKFNL